MTDKQIIRVLDAVEAGCMTSEQVSDFTGLSIAHCASYLTELERDGRVALLARKGKSRRYNQYAPA